MLHSYLRQLRKHLFGSKTGGKCASRKPRSARLGLVLLAVFLLPLFLPSACRAGLKAEHYDLVYALALTVGYSKKEAKMVADGSWSIDNNPDTLAFRFVGDTTSLFQAKDDILDTHDLLDKVKEDRQYALRLRTNDTKLEELIFTATNRAERNGWASRYAPAMVLHALMKDPTRMDVVSPSICRSRQETEAPGHFGREVAHRPAHPPGAVSAPGRRFLRPPRRARHWPRRPDANPRTPGPPPARVSALRSDRRPPAAAARLPGQDRSPETSDDRRAADQFKKFGLDDYAKRLSFVKGLVEAGASGYDPARKRIGFDDLDGGAPSDAELERVRGKIEQYMNSFYKSKGLAADVKILPFQRVYYKAVGKQYRIWYGLDIQHLDIDSVCYWARDDKEMSKSMRESMRKGLFKGYEILGSQLYEALFTRMMQANILKGSTTSQGTPTPQPRVVTEDLGPKDSQKEGGTTKARSIREGR